MHFIKCIRIGLTRVLDCKVSCFGLLSTKSHSIKVSFRLLSTKSHSFIISFYLLSTKRHSIIIGDPVLFIKHTAARFIKHKSVVGEHVFIY